MPTVPAHLPGLWPGSPGSASSAARDSADTLAALSRRGAHLHRGGVAHRLFYEKVFRVCFWDYSHLPLHLGRHACLRFALCWGVLALLIYYLLHPWVVWLVMHIPFWLAPPMAALLLVDTLLTAALLRRTQDTGALRWYLHLSRRKPA